MPEMQQYYLVADTTDVLDDIIPLTANDLYPIGFPGYVGMSAENLTVDAFIPRDPLLAVPNSMDAQGMHIDYTSFGDSGEVNRNSYAILGPVEPNSVEDFQLYGNVAPGQRRIENGVGPVGAYDHGDYTGLQLAQQMSAEAYDNESLVSLLTGGM